MQILDQYYSEKHDIPGHWAWSPGPVSPLSPSQAPYHLLLLQLR